MTVDDLVALLEAMTQDHTARTIGTAPVAKKLSDEHFNVLVRFIAGERPQPTVGLMDHIPRVEGRPGRVYRDPGQMPEDWEEDDTEFVQRPERQNPSEPLVLGVDKAGNDFSGVELP
jgi:hypothetical protein